MRTYQHIATSVIFAFLIISQAFGQFRKCVTIVDSREISGLVRTYASSDKLYIPILFHVVYRSPDQNISLEQIQSQIEVLNDDFSANNPNWSETIEAFAPHAADPNIEFYLFNDDHLDLPENGIIRVETNHGTFVDNDLHYALSGGSDAYLPEEVLNVWVADLGGDVFGYSQSGSAYPLGESGVIVDFEYLGTLGTVREPFSGGRTLTHEIGHYFGLKHPWLVGDCGDGDGISDTPDQNGAIVSCDLLSTSCEHTDMTQNFMNLAPDQCMTFFTAGQVLSMRSTLTLRLSGLIHEAVILTNSARPEVTVYPIPSSEAIHIAGIVGPIQNIVVYDLMGRPVKMDLTFRNQEVLVKPMTFTEGIYLMKFKVNGQNYTRKLIFEK